LTFYQCIWWQKSTRYAGDVILSDTIGIYREYLSLSSSINIKRNENLLNQDEINSFLQGIIMILSTAQEFNRMRNSNIIDRLSDNIEIPQVSYFQSKISLKQSFLVNQRNSRCTRKN